MSAVSLFQNFTQWVEDKSLIIITNEILNGKYKEEISKIRSLVKEGKIQEADNFKKQLLGFTTSGTFKNGRNAKLITSYSGYIILDIDKLNQQQLIEVKQKAIKEPFTLAAFISPSGNGLKIIVSVNNTIENHDIAYLQIVKYYNHKLECNIDTSGKDICRLCFMSYDEECYRNIHSTPFNVITKKAEVIQINTKVAEPLILNTDYETKFQECVDFTKKKSTYYNGNRNNFIHLLACNCNRAGIPILTTSELINNNFDLDYNEIKSTVKSAYSIIQTVEIRNDELKEQVYCETLDNMIEKAKNAPKLKFLWSGIMIGSFGFIFGPSKSGKTIFCENLALAIAGGLDEFFKIKIEEKSKKVLFISMEEYWQPRTERNQKQSEFLKFNLGDKYIIVDEKFPRILNSKEDWIFLETQIQKSGAEVVFIDSLSRMYSGSIEESNTAKEISLKLRELADKLKITLIVIHHTPKQIGRPITIDSLAGSRILAQEADFMIGISKSIDGTRYMKEVAFRYKPENDETVTTFIINQNACLETTNIISEGTLLKEKDGRTDDTNTRNILEYIEEKCKSPQEYATTRDLMETFVDTEIMSKPTLYSQLKKLQSKGKITNPDKGIYKLK